MGRLSTACMVLLSASAAFAVDCSKYSCPTGRELAADPTSITCPNAPAGSCTEQDAANTAACCPESLHQETGAVDVTDNYIPLIVVNVIMAIPLGIVIGLMIWSVRSISRTEKNEVAHLEEQASLFMEMENESMRRSHKSSMFLKSERRRSMRMSMVPLSMAAARPMQLTLEKQVGTGMGFGVEDMVVVDVLKGSPADIAGVQNGMVIKEVDERVVAPHSILQAIKEAPNRFTLLALIKEAPRDNDMTRSSGRSFGNGGSMSSFKQMARLFRFRLSQPGEDEVLGLQVTGLDVTKLQPGGIAEQAGMKPGMQVYAVNGTRATVQNIGKLVTNAPETFLVDCLGEFDDTASMLSGR